MRINIMYIHTHTPGFQSSIVLCLFPFAFTHITSIPHPNVDIIIKKPSIFPM